MVVPAKLRKLLEIVECRDVYEFLKLDRSASPEKLRAAAQKRYEGIQNQGRRGRPWDEQKELTGLCASIFKNDDTKRDYDRALKECEERGEPDEPRRHFREFDEATALLETGMDFVRQGRVRDAVVIARRLEGDVSEYSKLRMIVAGLLTTRRMDDEAMEFLAWCESEEPNNDKYKSMLVVCP